jgi:hypothetical protein
MVASLLAVRNPAAHAARWSWQLVTRDSIAGCVRVCVCLQSIAEQRQHTQAHTIPCIKAPGRPAAALTQGTVAAWRGCGKPTTSRPPFYRPPGCGVAVSQPCPAQLEPGTNPGGGLQGMVACPLAAACLRCNARRWWQLVSTRHAADRHTACHRGVCACWEGVQNLCVDPCVCVGCLCTGLHACMAPLTRVGVVGVMRCAVMAQGHLW